jgi:sulfur-carrier protein
MLRDQVDGQREVVASGETVREVLAQVTVRYPSLAAQLFEGGELTPFVNVYVGRNDVRTLAGLDTPVGGDPVILLPAMAGGAGVAQVAEDDYSRMTVSAHTPVAICEGLLIVRARPR